MKQQKEDYGNKRKKVSGHILAVLVLILSFYFMYAHIENYVSEQREGTLEQVEIYEKWAEKGLFGKPTYFLGVGHSDTRLYSASTYKKTFQELDIGDVVEGYIKGDYFYTGKGLHGKALTFYIILFLISLYPLGYFLYNGFRIQFFVNWFDSMFSRVLKPLMVICIVGIMIIYTLPFFVNGVQKALPYGKINTEAIVIDSEEKVIANYRSSKLIAKYLTLAYSNRDGESIFTKKEVTHDAYLEYRDATNLRVPVSYRAKNEHDIFIRGITISDVRYIITDVRFFFFVLILFIFFILTYFQLHLEWKNLGLGLLKYSRKKKDLFIRSLFWRGRYSRYISLILYIISCASAMILLIFLLISEETPSLRTLLYLNLNPVICFAIGLVSMFIMRIFGSSLRNELSIYIPEQGDVVINRTTVPWVGGLLKIACKIWVVTYIPWFVTVLISWENSLRNLTIVQGVILFLAFIPMIIYLSQMYRHLNDCLRNAPILIMSKEKLRCPHSSYPWSDIKGFRSLGGGELGVLVRKNKMEKYKVSSSTVYTLNQEDLAEDISTVYQELRTFKKNSSKRSGNND